MASESVEHPVSESPGRRVGTALWRARVPAAVAAIALLALACAQSAPREVSPVADSALASGGGVPSLQLSGNQTADRERLDSLDGVARSLARTEGCSSVDGCATIALGAKACGGPREYLVYCRTGTDTASLMRTVELVNRLEREFNQRYEVVSNCMMMMEPGVALEGGRCVADFDRAGNAP